MISILNDFSAKNTKQKCIYFNINNALPGRLYVCTFVLQFCKVCMTPTFFPVLIISMKKRQNQLTVTEKIQLQFF